MVAGRAATPQATTRRLVSVSSKTFSARRRRSARQSWPLLWRPQRGVDISRADEYTVATWLRSWYDIYAKPNVRVATADRYRLMIEQYTIPCIGSIKLTKLTAHDLQKLYKELMESGRTNRKSAHGSPGLSSTTVRNLHLMLHNALNRAVKERLILRNPTEDCDRAEGAEIRDADPPTGAYQDLSRRRG